MTVVTTIKRVLQGSKLQPLLVVLLLRWIPCSSDVGDVLLQSRGQIFLASLFL